jgi:hypothetical protein
MDLQNNRKRNIVEAFKELQTAVKMQNINESGNPRLRCMEPPLGYTTLAAIVEEKRK